MEGSSWRLLRNGKEVSVDFVGGKACRAARRVCDRAGRAFVPAGVLKAFERTQEARKSRKDKRGGCRFLFEKGVLLVDPRLVSEVFVAVERKKAGEVVTDFDAVYEKLKATATFCSNLVGYWEDYSSLVRRAERRDGEVAAWVFEFNHLPPSYNFIRGLALKRDVLFEQAIRVFYRCLVGEAVKASGVQPEPMDAVFVFLGFCCSKPERIDPDNRLYALKYILDGLTLWRVIANDRSVSGYFREVPSNRDGLCLVVARDHPEDEEASRRVRDYAVNLALQLAR